MQNQQTTFWVFGYGSLIWQPGFAFERVERALLRGAHRRLCIYSHHYRGTPEHPGLVFGLERGGACAGMAFAVTPSDWPAVHAYLHEREQMSGVYRETCRDVRLASGETVPALVFLADPHHSQYAGRLDLDQQSSIVLAAHGSVGPNIDYVLNTAAHLQQLGISDQRLMALCARIKALQPVEKTESETS